MTGEDVDDILTHCFMAFGNGAAQHLKVEDSAKDFNSPLVEFNAVIRFRDHYRLLFMKNMFHQGKDAAGNDNDVTQKPLVWGDGWENTIRAAYRIGAYAANKAKQGDRKVISWDDLTAAMANYPEVCPHPPNAGTWCAP